MDAGSRSGHSRLSGPENPVRPHLADQVDVLKREVSSLTARLKPDVVLRIEDEGRGGLLFDPNSDNMLALNQTGTALLRWRPNRISLDEWHEALVNHYPHVDADTIREDVERFLMMVWSFAEPVK